MKILFDLNHPAHVHLFKNFIFLLRNNNHNVIVTARNKDKTYDLLEHYKIDYVPLSNPRGGFFGALLELIIITLKLYMLNKKHNFRVAFGTSPSIAVLTKIAGVQSINFNEDDDDTVPFFTKSTYPLTSTIVNPDCIIHNRWKNKRLFHSSLHELAYLHPNNFFPDREILEKYSLIKKEYIIVRFSALKAHHDIKARGISINLWKKIEGLLEGFKIVKSIEASNNHEIDPWDMHHVLAFSRMLISDSQTMTIEAAVLGVPSIRINSFVGRCSVIEELENKYKLTMGFKPEDEESAINEIKNVLINKNSENEWKKRKNIMLKEKIDLNEWIINYFKKELIYN